MCEYDKCRWVLVDKRSCFNSIFSVSVHFCKRSPKQRCIYFLPAVIEFPVANLYFQTKANSHTLIFFKICSSLNYKQNRNKNNITKSLDHSTTDNTLIRTHICSLMLWLCHKSKKRKIRVFVRRVWQNIMGNQVWRENSSIPFVCAEFSIQHILCVAVWTQLCIHMYKNRKYDLNTHEREQM